jgi:hypothetical protein
VSPFIEQVQQIVCHDIDSNFVEAVSIAIAWEYNNLYEELASDAALTDAYREEEFNRRRGDSVMKALARVAKAHGIPYEFHRLTCNGQRKLLIKAGRVILLQEPILTRSDHPSTSDYKRDLANVHSSVRQLELDLGDQPQRIRDWSGCVFGVLLHGSAGVKFTSEQKALGSIMLAVPDAAYKQWVFRLDLQQIAMFGRGELVASAPHSEVRQLEAVQEDKVVVTPKKRNSAKDTA